MKKTYTQKDKEINLIRQNPIKTKARTIYRSVDNLFAGGEKFLPTWDTTDHFHFICANCYSVADVMKVCFVPTYDRKVGSSLHFFLGCPKCGKSGQRKIYLKMRPDSCKFQHSFSNDSKLLIYTNSRTPAKIIQYTPKEKK